MKLLRWFLAACLLLPTHAHAGSLGNPIFSPSYVQLLDGVGNPIGSVAGALNVNATFTMPPLVTVTQGNPNAGGALAWHVIDDAFIADFNTWKTWADVALSTRASEATLSALNTKVTTTANGIKVDGSAVTQPVNITNVTLAVTQSTSPWLTSRNWTLLSGTDSVTSFQGGVWSVGRTWFLDFADDKVDVTGSSVSVSSSALPSGASTLAAQINGTQKSQQVDGSGNVQPAGDVAARGVFVKPTDGTNSQSYTAAGEAKVSVTQPIPAGTNTLGKVDQGVGGASAWKVDGSAVNQPVTQATSPWVDNVTQFGGSAVVTGTGASGAGIPRVTVSSDSNIGVTSLPATPAGTNTIGTVKIDGKTSVQLVRNDYSSVNVTTAAYTQLIASTSGATTGLFIFDSSGQTLFLATGAAASEVNKLYVVPGGNGYVPLAIPNATRVSIKAVSANATVGEINVTLLQ